MHLSALLTAFIGSASAISPAREYQQEQKAVEVTPALFDSYCYYPVPAKNFNLDRYLGKWYQVAGTRFSRTEGARCVAAEYKLNPNGTVAVFETGVVGDQRIGSNGTAMPAGRKYGGAGSFRVLFPGFPAPVCPGPSYVVQEYDAEHSIVQTSNWGTLFILARERNPPASKFDAWIRRAVCLGTKKENVIKFDQKDC